MVCSTSPRETSRAIALDADTGKQLWVFDPFSGGHDTARPCPIAAPLTGRDNRRFPAEWESPSSTSVSSTSRSMRASLLSIPKRAGRVQALAMTEPLIFAWGWRTSGRKEGTTQPPLPPFTRTWSLPDRKFRNSRRKAPVAIFAPLMSERESGFGDSTPFPGPAKLGTTLGKAIPGRTVRGPTCGPS